MKMLLNQTLNRSQGFLPARFFLALLVATVLFMAPPASVHAALVAYDDFDTAVGSNDTLTSRSIDRGNWSGTYQSSTKIFGITDRDEAVTQGASNLLDTSVQAFDPFGILKTTDTSSVFAVEQPGDAQPNFTATWEFDLSSAGNNDLSVGIDFAAMGDWSGWNGAFLFTASLDGGTEVELFKSGVGSSAWHNYYMENDEMFPPNPMQMQYVLTMDGAAIDNDFQRLYADISEFAGEDTLTIKFTSIDIPDDPNVFAFDNIGVYATVPVPGTVWLLGAGFLGFIGIRCRYQN